MSFHRQRAYGLLATLAIAQPFAYPLPQLRGLGSFVASNATEFRWNLLLFSAGILACATALLPRNGCSGQIGAFGLLLLGLSLVGFGEYAAEDRFSDDIALWGAPLHLLLAAALPLITVSLVFVSAGVNSVRTKFPAYAWVSLIALGLAALGLLWNFSQTSLTEGWAWDWIESGPVWALGGVVLRTHLWAKLLVVTLSPYVAFLALSRTALITSAHHLQSPQNTLSLELYGFEEFGRSLGYSAGLGLGFAFLLATAVASARCYGGNRVLPKTPAKTSLVRRGPGLYLPVLSVCVLAYPPLVVPTILASLVGGGWRWLTYTLALHSALVALLLAGMSLVWWAEVSGPVTKLNPSRWPSPSRRLGAWVEADLSALALLGGGGWLYFGQPRKPQSSVKVPGVCPYMNFAVRYPDLTKRWARGQNLSGIGPSTMSLFWANGRFNRHLIGSFARYAVTITVPYFRPTSVFGFSLIVGMYAQMYSGFLLALFYLPDPSFVIPTREDLFMEVWWFGYVYKAHVIGVDILFTLSYLHILKKFYLKNYSEGDLDGWFTGAYAFLIYHLVVFLGITLSTNHLGDVTIMIAANIFWSLFLRWHKVYAPFFSNKHLSTEQLTRFMVAHYISAWYYLYLVQTHVLFVHEMWDADSNRSTQLNTTTPKASWGWDALKKEIMTMFILYKSVALLYFLMAHPDAKVVNYAFFEQWSESEMEEINFFIVAPHWYFRPHMGLLTVCAHHYEGLAWLVGFYVLLCYTPHLYRFWNRNPRPNGVKADTAPTRHSVLQEMLYVGLFSSMLYVGGTLPCGRFYYENIEGFFGNSFLRISYEYVYIYLAFLAHTVDAFERWYLGAALHKLFFRRLLAVLRGYGARRDSFSASAFLLSLLPEISLNPKDWYAYALNTRDSWRTRLLLWRERLARWSSKDNPEV